MPSPRRRHAIAAGVVAAAFGLAGCDTGDGRALADPPPGVTAPVLGASTTATSEPPSQVLPAGTEESSLVLGSPAFAAGEPIPLRYACTGDNISPPLTWSGVPAAAVELALTMVDIDVETGQFVHWVVTGLAPSLVGLEEGAVPEGAIEARNDSSEFGWYGPCPPAGETHRYVFTLYALSTQSGVVAGTGGPEALRQIAVVQGDAAVLSGTFTG